MTTLIYVESELAGQKQIYVYIYCHHESRHPSTTTAFLLLLHGHEAFSAGLKPILR